MRKIIPVLILMLMLTSCNIPGSQAEKTAVVDPTIQSLYDTATARAEDIPATITAAVTAAEATLTQAAQELPTQTAQPSATAQPVVPSNTPVPPTAVPPTPTIPSARPGLTVEAVNWSAGGLVLDGDWSEWKNKGTEYSASNLVFGKSNWTGSEDLSASYYAGWDANYLYLAVKVNDDKYVQNNSGENLFQGDSIEVLLDTKLRDDYYVKVLSPDDFQLGFTAGEAKAGDGVVEAYMWFPTELKGSKAGIKIAAVQEDGRYRVEAAIPWSVFEVVPQSGMRMGFALSVSDCDTPGGTSQESMVSSAAGRSLLNPTTWHNIVLK